MYLFFLCGQSLAKCFQIMTLLLQETIAPEEPNAYAMLSALSTSKMGFGPQHKIEKEVCLILT